MPVGLSPANIARFVAGVLAAIWAMGALANEYLTVAAVGPSVSLIIAIVLDIFLLVGASLAFVNARGWRTVFMIALGSVTVDRFVDAAGSGAALEQIASSFIAFVAIAAIAMIGSRFYR